MAEPVHQTTDSHPRIRWLGTTAMPSPSGLIERSLAGKLIPQDGATLWPCLKCGAAEPTQDGHDPCIANLPGVKAACCGHGLWTGYAAFEDGRVIRGDFDHV